MLEATVVVYHSSFAAAIEALGGADQCFDPVAIGLG